MNTNNFYYPKVGFGTFNVDNQALLNELVKECISQGCTYFDTAPSYGTEQKLGQAIAKAINELGLQRSDVKISTKIDGWQMQSTNGDVQFFVQEALKKMDLEYFDIVFIHWPFLEYLHQTMHALNELKEQGLIKKIGICNLSKRVLNNYINEEGILPDVIQNEISPLNTGENDYEYFCELNIAIQAYSPLCKMNEKIRTNTTLQHLAEKYGTSIAQIILKWHLQREICPIFSTTKVHRIKDNLDLDHFELTENEILEINQINEDYKIYVESFGCPGI